MLKIPCPTSHITNDEIQIFKKLRLTYLISEVKTCAKCPLADKCPYKNRLP